MKSAGDSTHNLDFLERAVRNLKSHELARAATVANGIVVIPTDLSVRHFAFAKFVIFRNGNQPVAPFPAGFNPGDPGFEPDSSGCDCKWSLIKGVLNCSTGGQGHSYVATLQCPTTGAQVVTRKQATPNTPCP